MGKIADVSHHQGVIDWNKASKELDLVIIRTKYGSNTTDRQYKNNVAGAQKYKVPYGLYHYAQFVSVKDAIQEAKDFLKTATHEAKFLVLDVEEQTCNTVSELVQATQVFINICKAEDYRVGLYTGHHFYDPYRMDQVEADFLWIPRYSSKKPIYKCDLWQYTDSGKVSGIKGNVDLNVLNGDKSLEWFIDESSVSSDNKSLNINKSKGIGYIKVLKNNILRAEPTPYSEQIKMLKKDEVYYVYDIKNDWYNLGPGWAKSEKAKYFKYYPHE